MFRTLQTKDILNKIATLFDKLGFEAMGPAGSRYGQPILIEATAPVNISASDPRSSYVSRRRRRSRRSRTAMPSPAIRTSWF